MADSGRRRLDFLAIDLRDCMQYWVVVGRLARTSIGTHTIGSSHSRLGA